jgi:hypothetical protein
MPGPRPSRRVALACALALAALLAALFGPLTFRVLQAWRHHGPERA